MLRASKSRGDKYKHGVMGKPNGIHKVSEVQRWWDLPKIGQLDCWKIWINKNSLPDVENFFGIVGLPQSYNIMPHQFAHKIMPFPWHLHQLEMTPPIDPTCLQPFNKVKLPSNLETLTFGEKFNQILELPPKLCLRFWWPISRPHLCEGILVLNMPMTFRDFQFSWISLKFYIDIRKWFYFERRSLSMNTTYHLLLGV